MRGGRRLRALIVDDEPDIRLTLSRFFEGRGVKTVACSCAEDAIEAVKKENFSFILLDNDLPGAMGITALEELGELTAAPVVMMTGFDDPDTRNDALLIGARAYLSKPFELAELWRVVKEFVEPSSPRAS